MPVQLSKGNSGRCGIITNYTYDLKSLVYQAVVDLLFTEDDLFKALTEDERFIVEDVGRGAFFAQVRVARKRR